MRCFSSLFEIVIHRDASGKEVKETSFSSLFEIVTVRFPVHDPDLAAQFQFSI